MNVGYLKNKSPISAALVPSLPLSCTLCLISHHAYETHSLEPPDLMRMDSRKPIDL